ncbi:glucose-6-phosphate isomerase [Alphaproteobacteria bacterium]|nr:glucose-6-phosphate isomerase [Alphaproteobacteria bacterium]
MQQILTHAIDAAAQPHFDGMVEALSGAHGRYQNRPLPHMLLCDKTDDIAAMQTMADALGDSAARILILGTGGSSLGAQVLAQVHGALTPAGKIAAPESGPDLIFVDNLDAETYARLLAGDLSTSRFLVVSKSGGTAETMMQAGGAILALEAQGLAIGKHMGGIAGRGDNALRRLATAYGFSLLEHEEEIGGRFSVFTNVGLLPAIWAGGNVQKIRAGAASVMAGLSSAAADYPPLLGAAAQLAHMAAGRNISVMMAYADRLERLAFWYRQIWAESLGKQGNGSVPVNALGPVDQHSQMQLYMAGPDDKFYTVLTQATRGHGTSVPDSFADDAGLAALAGHTMGNLVDAEARGTMDTLVEAGRPLRHMALAGIDDESIGALLMHFQLETIYAANGLGVDAFDQPAVEAGKIRAKHYLSEMA